MTNSAVINTKLNLSTTFAITIIIVGILTSGANISIGIFPALSTAVVDKISVLKRRDAFTLD